MSLLWNFFKYKKPTANIAKERLKIILAHERVLNSTSDHISWLPQLQEELVAVISKYIAINKDDLKVNLEHKDNVDLLEINITLPEKN